MHPPALIAKERSFAARIVAYDVFLLACCVIGGIAALFVHEAIGHSAVAWLLGAKLQGITLSVMGGGTARYQLPDDAGAVRRLLPLAGGIVITVALGVVALTQAKRARVPLRLAMLCFGALAVLRDLGYAAFGLYHGWGDPGDIAELLGVARSSLVLHESALWIPFALCLLPASAFAMREYLVVQDEAFPCATRAARLWRTSLTIGVIVAAVMALEMTVGRETSPVVRRDLRAEVIRGTRIVAMLKEVQAAMPNASEKEISREVEVRIASIDAPAELPRDLPMQAILLALVVLSGLVTTLYARPRQREGQADVSPSAAALATAAAIALSALVVLNEGRLH